MTRTRILSTLLAIVLALTACTSGDESTDDPAGGRDDTADGDDDGAAAAGEQDAGGATPQVPDSGEEPGLIVSPVHGNTAGVGAVADFTVVLASRPEAEVVVPVASTDEGQGAVETSELRFSAENWFIGQHVRVVGTAEGQQDYQVALGPVVSSDAGYDRLDVEDVPMRGIQLTIDPPISVEGIVPGVGVRLRPRVTYTGHDALSFSLPEGPAGMDVDLESGLLTWTPEPSQAGQVVTVRVAATDGTLVSELDLDLPVLAPQALVSETVGDTINVLSAPAGLEDLTITHMDGEQALDELELHGLPLSDAPELPQTVTPLSDVLVVQNGADTVVDLRLPLDDLPDGVTHGDINLYTFDETTGYGQHPDEEDPHGPASGPSWFAVGREDWEEVADDGNFRTTVAGLEGHFVLGYGSDATTADTGATDGTADAPEATPTPAPVTTATEDGITCTKRADTADHEYQDVSCRKGSSRILIYDWGRQVTDSPFTGDMSIFALTKPLFDVQARFAEGGLTFETTFWIRIEENAKDYGWVRGDEQARKQLHLADFVPAELLASVAIHEYFHHVQGRTGNQIGDLALLGNSGTGAGWLLESMARTFEDVVYDEANVYLRAQGHPKVARILELGLDAHWEEDPRSNAYARWAFFKMLRSMCTSYRDRLLLSTDVSTDPTGIRRLVDQLDDMSCDFGAHFGADQANTIGAALARYNHATLRLNDLSQLDSNEPAVTGGAFVPPETRTAAAALSEASDGEVLDVFNGHVPRAGARSYLISALDGQVPAGKVVELVVQTDQPLLVSLASSDRSIGDGTIGEDAHAWFSTRDQTEFSFAGGTVPEVFLTLVNASDRLDASSVDVSIEVRDG